MKSHILRISLSLIILLITTTLQANSLKQETYSKTSQLAPKFSWRYFWSHRYYSRPVVAMDHTIYVTTDILYIDENPFLLAISPEGKLLWKFELNGRDYTIAHISEDGTIYVGNYVDLYAVNKNGSEQWHYVFHEELSNFTKKNNELSKHKKDLLFFRSYSSLRAINLQGQLIWEYTVPFTNNVQGQLFPPVIANDGNIYVTESRGTPPSAILHALNCDGKERWRYVTSEHDHYISSPAVDSKGNVYIYVTTGLISLDSEGKQRWKIDFNYSLEKRYSPSIDPEDDTVYADGLLPRGHVAIAVSQDGNIKWKIGLPGKTLCQSPVVSSDGIIYFNSRDDNFVNNWITAIKKDIPMILWGPDNLNIDKIFRINLDKKNLYGITSDYLYGFVKDKSNYNKERE